MPADTAASCTCLATGIWCGFLFSLSWVCLCLSSCIFFLVPAASSTCLCCRPLAAAAEPAVRRGGVPVLHPPAEREHDVPAQPGRHGYVQPNQLNQDVMGMYSPTIPTRMSWVCTMYSPTSPTSPTRTSCVHTFQPGCHGYVQSNQDIMGIYSPTRVSWVCTVQPGCHGYVHSPTRMSWVCTVQPTQPGCHGYVHSPTRMSWACTQPNQDIMGSTSITRMSWVHTVYPGCHGYVQSNQDVMGTYSSTRMSWVCTVQPGCHG